MGVSKGFSVIEIFLNPEIHGNKSLISIRKPNFNVTLREISGIITDLSSFSVMRNEHDELMDIFDQTIFSNSE